MVGYYQNTYVPTIVNAATSNSIYNTMYNMYGEMGGGTVTGYAQTDMQLTINDNTNVLTLQNQLIDNMARQINIIYQTGNDTTTARGYTTGYTMNADGMTSINLRMYPYGWTDTGTGVNSFLNLYLDNCGHARIDSVKDRMKRLLQTRLAPRILTHAKPLGFTKDMREIRARETLRRVLGDEKYKSFLCKGFISVQAKSGLVYQIFPGHDFTKVYNRGIMVDRYCVVLQGNFPPTDSLIMRYLMILNNEEQFKSYAVKHGAIQPAKIELQDNRSLLEIFKEMKRAA